MKGTVSVGVGETVCVTGRHFSTQGAAILWTHAMVQRYSSNMWVPAEIINRLALKFKEVNPVAPVSVCAANGGRLFYNASQLECPQEELVKRVEGLLEFCHVHDDVGDDETWPLDTNGQRLPWDFAREVRERIETRGTPLQSRFWATEDEAACIFGSAFVRSFLVPEHAVVLRGGTALPQVCYYNVSGTRDPNVFNDGTCRRYRPVNCYSQAYRAVVAVQMKAHAIRHGCLNENLWVTVKRAERYGVKIRNDMQPLVLCAGDIVSLVNIAMTEDPERLRSRAFSLASDAAGD